MMRPPLFVRTGETVHFDGICLDNERAIFTAKRIVAAETELNDAQGKLLMTVPVFVGLIAAALAIGAAVGVGATVAAQR